MVKGRYAWRGFQCAAAVAAGALLMFSVDQLSSKQNSRLANAPAFPSRWVQQKEPTSTSSSAENLSSTDSISFVSLNLIEVPDPIVGFGLADILSGEFHFLGHRTNAAPQQSGFVLQLETEQETLNYPVSCESDGICKALVPLPLLPIKSMHILAH